MEDSHPDSLVSEAVCSRELGLGCRHPQKGQMLKRELCSVWAPRGFVHRMKIGLAVVVEKRLPVRLK